MCCVFYKIVPQGYPEVANIPIAKPGRRLYNVRNPVADHLDSVLIQMDALEGNKVITIRSPLQVKMFKNNIQLRSPRTGA